MNVSVRKSPNVSLLISVLALTLFVALGLSLDSRWLRAVDEPLLLTSNVSSPSGRQLFWLITTLGSDYALGAALLLTSIILYRAGKPAEMLTTIALGAAAKLSEEGLKALYHRSRPTGFTSEVLAGYSFPSGHSLNTLAIYGACWY